MSIEDHLYKYLKTYKTMPAWARRLVTAPFKLFPRSVYLGKVYRQYYKTAMSLEYASEADVSKYQFGKLKQLLQLCYDTVPYYSRTWKRLGVDIQKIQSFDDFKERIPLIHKSDIQENPMDFVSNFFPERDRLKMNTGGSTGNPLTLYYLKGYSRPAEWAHMFVMWNRLGYRPGSRMGYLRGDYFGSGKEYSFDPWRNALMLSSYALTHANADRYLDLLSKYKVEYISAYPSSLCSLVQLASIDQKKFSFLKAVFLSSENVMDWQRKTLNDFFKVPIWAGYGHTEICAMGGGCEQSDIYHFMPSYGYTEFLPVEDELVEIVGTSFINPLMPLVRYKTQDYGILQKNRCACGRNQKQLRRISGRKQELAIGKNGEKITLTALIFGRHAEYFNHIVRMQIVNKAPGSLLVKVIPKDTFTYAHRREIEQTLSEHDGMPFITEVECVSMIPYTSRGKHRLLVKEF